MRAAASAALAAAALLAGCGGDGGGGEEKKSKGSDSEQVQAAATDYTRAFGRGDGERACALLTPGAREALVKRVESLVKTRECPAAVTKLQSLAGPNVSGPFLKATAEGAKVRGDSASATIVAAGHREVVMLERQGGEWLLSKAPGV